jgi:hypothetical protein
MPNAMVPLANGVLGTGTNSVSFTSISQDYKDLLLVCEVIIANSNTSISISFNSNSPASNRIFLQGENGSQTISSGASTVIASSLGSGLRPAINCSVMGYSATDKGKVAIVRSGAAAPAAGQSNLALLSQNSTTAITSVTINLDGAKLMSAGSEFALYGIR